MKYAVLIVGLAAGMVAEDHNVAPAYIWFIGCVTGLLMTLPNQREGL